MHWSKNLILSLFGFVVSNAARAVLLLILLFVLGHGFEQIPKYKKFPLLKKIVSAQQGLERPVTGFLKAKIPTKLSRFDLSSGMVFVGMFLLWIGLELEKERLAFLKNELVRGRKRTLRAASSKDDEFFKDGKGEVVLTRAETVIPSKREELLELYAQTKRTLEDQKKEVSFLSMDIVNSTGMKQGEDPALAERDFRQYKKLVEAVLKKNEVLKAAWTPDGVMICFPSSRTAIAAAQQVIGGLKEFNKNVKTMKADFQLRTGINTGRVLYDDSVKMEEMSDRVIDIAGHMQKYAQVNSIFLGKHVVDGLEGDHGFTPASTVVDDCEVYVWQSAVETVPAAG